jgi:hypothetical protein
LISIDLWEENATHIRRAVCTRLYSHSIASFTPSLRTKSAQRPRITNWKAGTYPVNALIPNLFPRGRIGFQSGALERLE